MSVDHRLRVVIDSDAWISAAPAPAGAPAQVARHVLQHGVPVFSPATFEELRSRLLKPTFDRYLLTVYEPLPLTILTPTAALADVRFMVVPVVSR